MKHVIKSALAYEIPVKSQKTGISNDWYALWWEIEIFYGDIDKNENETQFLTRMQNEYDLKLKRDV